MAMKGHWNDRINGYGAILRFITPLMVGLVLALLNQNLLALTVVREEVKDLRITLSNHVMTELTGIRERLSRLEATLKVGGR